MSTIEENAPTWLQDALADVPVERDIDVEGAVVHYLSWGHEGNPGVVLVHGGLAHAHWWDHIAPLLTGHHVIALDLTGHGDSGARESYDVRQWAREIAAVITASNLVRPVIVGHSMGGYPTVATAVEFPDAIRGVVTIDTRFNDEDYKRGEKKSRLYASVDDAAADFAPVHARAALGIPTTLLRHVAETSLRREGNAWRWKRDDRYRIIRTPLRDLLPAIGSPLAIIQTQFGLVTDEVAAEMRALAPSPSVNVMIPAAGHNPMLEQPLALVSVLRTLLKLQWTDVNDTR